MVLQATRVGLQAIIEGYFSTASCKLILLNDSDALTSASAVVDFITLEPETAEGYARQSVTPTGWAWDASSSAIKSTTVSATYTAGSSGVIQYDAAALLVGGGTVANKEVSGIASNLITANGHGLSAGDKVIFTDATAAPSGITLGTVYYVIASGLTANAFKIAATSGGSALTIGSSWTGTLVVRNVNGTIFVWEQRPDDGSGNRTYTINSGLSNTVQFQIGQTVD